MRADHGLIRAEADAAGFVLAGLAPLAPLERGAFLAEWLADGRAAEMTYLARRTAERIDPRLYWPWARSVVALAWPYAPGPPAPRDWRETLRGRIAAYALGADYHERVAERLAALAARLETAYPGARFHGYVDTGPLLEREWAARAGLGWIGRNTLLLQRERGSWFFLAELLTSLEADPPSQSADHCGTCTRCHAACPTGALGPGYEMDPRRCISYWTIEHRGTIPTSMRPALENWVFGCDVCQNVCPWNADVAGEPGRANDLLPYLPDLLALDPDAFRARFGRTAVARTKRRGLLRNVAVALGNSRSAAAVPPLRAALATEPDALIRAHAAWALGRIGDRGAHSALDAARHRETEPAVVAEIVSALDETPGS